LNVDRDLIAGDQVANLLDAVVGAQVDAAALQFPVLEHYLGIVGGEVVATGCLFAGSATCGIYDAVWRFLGQWLRDASRVQDAFDGCQRWHLLEQAVVTDLQQHRLRADQANLALLQGASHGQYNRVGVPRRGLRRLQWSARAIIETLPAQGGKAQPPFAQPLACAREAREYLARAPAFERESDRLAAPIQFVVVLCHSVPPLATLWQQPGQAHDVVSHGSIRLPTMS
jgi:hypothetical protein